MSDPSQGKVKAFLYNGGGTLTFRTILFAMAAVTLWLIQAIGHEITDDLHHLSNGQDTANIAIAKMSQKVDATADIASHNTERLDDHEHRLTVLETLERPKP